MNTPTLVAVGLLGSVLLYALVVPQSVKQQAGRRYRFTAEVLGASSSAAETLLKASPFVGGETITLVQQGDKLIASWVAISPSNREVELPLTIFHTGAVKATVTKIVEVP